MDFEEIFAEYYSLFRGQGTAIPAFGDREFLTAIYAGNNAIRKWDRVDGTLWNELVAVAQDQSVLIYPTLAKNIASGTLSYAAPSNMRKPPAEVWFYSSGQYHRVPVVPSSQISGLSELAGYVTFLGSANTGYTMRTNLATSSQYDTYAIDYLYYKKPTFFTIATDPSAIIPDMSDPNFLVQEMLASAYANARNGFGYKTAKADAKEALMNMKIENSSGVPLLSDRMPLDRGWGANIPLSRDII